MSAALTEEACVYFSSHGRSRPRRRHKKEKERKRSRSRYPEAAIVTAKKTGFREMRIVPRGSGLSFKRRFNWAAHDAEGSDEWPLHRHVVLLANKAVASLRCSRDAGERCKDSVVRQRPTADIGEGTDQRVVSLRIRG